MLFVAEAAVKAQAAQAANHEHLIEAARAARHALDWRGAAVQFTQAADALPTDPHTDVTATALQLRRSAHLCLSMTPQFYRHRERRKGASHPAEWRTPSGDLVDLLLPNSAEPRVHLRKAVTS